jgi:cell division protein FtsQ
VVIGDPAPDAAPGSGATIDPLIEPYAEQSSSGRVRTSTATIPMETAEGASSEAAGEGSGPRVVVIEGDDLPDASYTAQSTRGPDDPGGPRVHPRLKARRIAVRQGAGRRRFWWFSVFAVLLLMGLAAVAILSTPLFAISTIRISGVVYTDQEVITEITSSIRHKPILTADLNGVRRRLEALPWVKAATVVMRFPHTVLVQVSERTPITAYLGEDNLWRVIDVEGRVIDVLEGRPVDYMAIYGAGPMLKAGEATAEYGRVAQLITSLPPQLKSVVKVFEVDQQYNVSLTLRLNKRGDTQVDLCSANKLDVLQVVSLTAFINTKVDPKKAPPARITACEPTLITTADR